MCVTSPDCIKQPPFGSSRQAFCKRPLRSLKLSPDGRLCPGLMQTIMKSVFLTLLIVSGFAGCVFAGGDGSTDYCLIGAGPGGILVVCTGRISFSCIFQNYSSFWTIVLAKYSYRGLQVICQWTELVNLQSELRNQNWGDIICDSSLLVSVELQLRFCCKGLANRGISVKGGVEIAVHCKNDWLF